MMAWETSSLEHRDYTEMVSILGELILFDGLVSGSMIAAEADVIIFGGSAARRFDLRKRLIS